MSVTPSEPSPGLAATADPLISVLIATNRRGEYLDDALRSLESQTYRNWEAIVVDDGSPTPDELDRIVGRYEKVRLIHQSNSGVSIARNVAVNASEGEYCAFLDDDDRWSPERLALQVAAFEGATDVVLTYGRVESVDMLGNKLAPSTQQSAKDVHEIFNGLNTPQFQAVTVRRDALLRVGGFHSALSHAEDLDLILRLAREGRFVYIDAEVAQYRRHDANATGSTHALATAIDAVLRLHEMRAKSIGDGTLRDLHERRRANARFALWSATRTARQQVRVRRYRAAAAEIRWALWFAPIAPVSAIGQRLGRLRERVLSARRPR